MLDTNAYSALLKGDFRVGAALRAADEILLPPFVIGELEAGFRNGMRYEENLSILIRFMDKPGVREVAAGRETARLYGIVKDDLKRAGRPIPANDIWIAASCIEHGCALLTYDRHFSLVARLDLYLSGGG
jgi:tRNA(fMet)-specific endonuclease VapC